MDALESFQQEVKTWLEEHCPASMRTPQPGHDFSMPSTDDVKAWGHSLAERGWTMPSWPREYGGGGHSKEEADIIASEMAAIGTRNPVVSFGTMMLGPVLLEFASHEQKLEHLPKITRGDITWCQGYSEPGSGSDLASLQTRAVLDGDHYVINGQKIWTSFANMADWIFCLVRTDPDAPKHSGISFILFDLKSEGVTIKPIMLISGTSQFCEIFFEDVRAHARNLIGTKNQGWTIAKRLLQFERTMLSGGGGGAPRRAGGKRKAVSNAGPAALAEQARKYLGPETGRLSEPLLRDEIAQLELDQLSLGLTIRRTGEEARGGQGPGAASSMFKLHMSENSKARQELLIKIMGAQGLGWTGSAFTQEELGTTRSWLRSKGSTIEGGTSEIQKNVIAKRVLELPS